LKPKRRERRRGGGYCATLSRTEKQGTLPCPRSLSEKGGGTDSYPYLRGAGGGGRAIEVLQESCMRSLVVRKGPGRGGESLMMEEEE